MAKLRKKLTSAQKRAKKKARKERQKKYMWVFRNGKQVRIKRPETIEGVDPDEFIRSNADPIWLHENELWEYMEHEENRIDVLGSSEMNPYMNIFCGEWKNKEGSILFIEAIDEEQVHVTYVKSNEKEPLLRPWFDNLPASKMIGVYGPEWDPSLNIELSKQGQGFYLSLDFDDGNYDTIFPSIIRNKKDNHLDKYYYLLGTLSPYYKQRNSDA